MVAALLFVIRRISLTMKKNHPLFLTSFVLLLHITTLSQPPRFPTPGRIVSNISPQSIPENILVSVDKTICLAGDSIFTKAMILQGNHLSGLSSTLYVDLIDSRGYLIDMKTFPVITGISLGQIGLPPYLSAGIYYLRAYTKWQLNFNHGSLFQIPISVLDMPSDQYTVFSRKNQPYFHHRTDSINIIGTFNPKGLYITVNADPTSPYLDSTLFVYFISPRMTGTTSLHLLPDSTYSFLCPLTPTTGGHDVDLILTTASDKVLLQHKLVRPPRKLDIELLTDTLDTSEKGLNSWTLKVHDTIAATLSIAITDAQIDSNHLPPHQILSTTRFNYEELLQGIPPYTPLVDSNYINLRGKAFRISDGKPIRNKALLAFITTKDSGKTFEEIPIDTAGRFTLRNLFYYDTAAIHFQLKDKERRSKDIVLKFDRFFRPEFSRDSNNYVFRTKNGLQQSPMMQVSKRKDNLFAYDKIGTLKEVTVRARKKTIVEKMDEEYARGAFKGGINSKGFDLINDHTALGAGNVLEYLSMRMPGLQVSRDATTGKVNGVTHRQESMLFFLNEMPCDVEQVLNMSMFQIAYVKVHPAPFVGGFLMKGAVAVYTKNGSDLEYPEPKDLAPVVVTARNMHRTLDKNYTTGIFAQRAEYAVDLRQSQKEFDLLRHLKEKIPGLDFTEIGPKLSITYHNQPVGIYIDEWEVMPGQLNLYRFNVHFLAYAKILTTFPSQGNFVNALALYTRQGADIDGVSAGLNKEKLAGYDPIAMASTPDYSNNKRSDYADNRISLYWDPMLRNGESRIRFYNNDYTKKFRVVIQGVSTSGELLQFETVVGRP